MKKPKKSGSDYYNYKGFFSLVPLALVDAEYRFMWIDYGSSGSCSDTQIFNRNDLREKIEDGTLMPWMVNPYSRWQLTREQRITNYRISKGRRVVENAFGILVSWFRVLLGTMEQRPRVYLCEDTPGKSRQGTH